MDEEGLVGSAVATVPVVVLAMVLTPHLRDRQRLAHRVAVLTERVQAEEAARRATDRRRRHPGRDQSTWSPSSHPTGSARCSASVGPQEPGA